MKLQEFQQQSKRTMPFNGAPSNPIEFENMLGNYAMGLVGEWFELQNEINKTSLKNAGASIPLIDKEVGDVLHYSVGLLMVLGETVTISKIGHEVKFEEVEEHLGNILEIPKKHIYHRHELNKEQLIKSIYEVIAYLYDNFGKGFEKIMQTNIDKLKTRYPDKFSTENSVARVDVK